MPVIVLMLLGLLAGCMKPSDLAREGRYYLGDVGLLSHHEIQRSRNMRLEQDALLYLAQSHFPPVDRKPHRVEPNILAKESFKSFVEYFPRMRRSDVPLGLDEAFTAAAGEQAEFLLYLRLAQTYDSEVLDSAVIQMMLYELSTGQLVDSARIPLHSGLLHWPNSRPEEFLRRPMRDYARRLQGLSP